MKWLMSALHLPTLDNHINELPRVIPSRALWYYENVRGGLNNSLFTLYDETLNTSVDSFFRAWMKAISHHEYYQMIPSGHSYVFTNTGDMPLTGCRDEAWREIDAQRFVMRQSLDAILARLKRHYIEIGIQEMNAVAWRD